MLTFFQLESKFQMKTTQNWTLKYNQDKECFKNYKSCYNFLDFFKIKKIIFKHIKVQFDRNLVWKAAYHEELASDEESESDEESADSEEQPAHEEQTDHEEQTGHEEQPGHEESMPEAPSEPQTNNAAIEVDLTEMPRKYKPLTKKC